MEFVDELKMMTDEFRIRKLIEEVLDSARTPEEVCEAYPELLHMVQMRLQQIRRVEDELNALFPSTTTESGKEMRPPASTQICLGRLRRKPILRCVETLKRIAKWARCQPAVAAGFFVMIVLVAAIIGAIMMRQQE